MDSNKVENNNNNTIATDSNKVDNNNDTIVI
jgi:hypothetical protein